MTKSSVQAAHTFAVLAYKRSPHLDMCLRSLIAQTVRSKILLCTSTPSDYLAEYSNRYQIPLKVNPHSGGIATDWSFAYAQPDTELVTLAHQDDIYYPQYTEKCLSAFSEASDALIAFTDYCELRYDCVIASNLNMKIKRILLRLAGLGFRIHRTKLQKRNLIRFGSPIPCPAVCYNRARIGCFSFDPTFKINLDWDAWERLSRRDGAFTSVPEIHMAHRIHEDSETTRGIMTSRRMDEDLLLFKRLWPVLVARLILCLYTFSYASNK